MTFLARYNEDILREQYEKLPKILKDALFSADTAARMLAIGKKFELTIEEIGYMAEETGYAVLGLTKPSQFAQIVASRLRIPQEKSQRIAAEINTQVFYPLREALKQTPATGVSDDLALGPADEPHTEESIHALPIDSEPAPAIVPGIKKEGNAHQRMENLDSASEVIKEMPPSGPEGTINLKPAPPPFSNLAPPPSSPSRPSSSYRPPLGPQKPSIVDLRKEISAPAPEKMIEAPHVSPAPQSSLEQTLTGQAPPPASSQQTPAQPPPAPKRPAPAPAPYELTPEGKPVYKEGDPYREMPE